MPFAVLSTAGSASDVGMVGAVGSLALIATPSSVPTNSPRVLTAAAGRPARMSSSSSGRGVAYLVDPLVEPRDGQALLCCSVPTADLVIARRPRARTASMATWATSVDARMGMCRSPRTPVVRRLPGMPPARPGGAFVRQDPRAGLDDVEVRRLLQRVQDRVRRQPRLVADDVVADVVHRWQANRRPVRVERLTTGKRVR